MHHHREALRILILLVGAALVAGCIVRRDPPPTRGAVALIASGHDAPAAAGAGASSVGVATGNLANPVIALLPAAAAVSVPQDAGVPDAAPKQAPITSTNSCGRGRAEATLEPVNMFVMIDRSGSMDTDNKWIDTAAALLTFFRDPKAAGIRVALRFFPADVPVPGCSDTRCDAQACAQPLVPLGELSAAYGAMDAQERALVLAIANSNPSGGEAKGGSPTHPALDGALRWALDYQQIHPHEKTVVVFATDGQPNGCDASFDDIAALAARALQAAGITTYAIGLKGSTADQINQLARAGGTNQGIFVDPGPNAEQALVAALNGIRGQTLSCDFAIPASTDPSMATIDPTRVNVTLSPSSGAPGTLSQVSGLSACGDRKSWYYDAPDKPTRISLCPTACELARTDSSAMLEVLFGCATLCGGDPSCGSAPPPPEVPPELF